MRMVLLLLPLVACEFRPSDLVAINGVIDNQSDTAITAARTYVLEEDEAVDIDDCEDRLESEVLPGELGEVQWPPLTGARGWAIEIVLETGDCLVMNDVSRDWDVVVPAEPEGKGWNAECRCSDL